MDVVHIPVMLTEVLSALDPAPGGRYVDGTAGGGGHTRALLERAGSSGSVLALDQDPSAVERLERDLGRSHGNLIVRQSNFSRLAEVLADLGWGEVDGVLVDLGLSSYQLEGSGRGFSFSRNEPLDMRMDPESGRPASELVNRLPERELADLIFKYGEERASRRVARGIVWARKRSPIQTSAELAEVVRRSLRRPGRPPRIDPATRTFQALRLAVNRELEHLEYFLQSVPGLLKTGGRLAAISFHSLEDRLVKEAMLKPGRGNRETAGQPVLEALYKKPLRPSVEEMEANPRSRSARLRAGARI